MKVITFAHQKGGVGKSTMVINVAHALKKKGFSVAVKDIDLQGTSIACLRNIDIYEKQEEIKGKYDFLLVDTPPYLNPILVDLFIESNLVIIPTKPSIPDIVAISGTVNLFNQAKLKNKKLKGKILINQNISSSNLLDQLSDEISALGLGLFNTKIENRVSYGRSVIGEEGIFSEEDKKAQTEIKNLTDEILSNL